MISFKSPTAKNMFKTRFCGYPMTSVMTTDWPFCHACILPSLTASARSAGVYVFPPILSAFRSLFCSSSGSRVAIFNRSCKGSRIVYSHAVSSSIGRSEEDSACSLILGYDRNHRAFDEVENTTPSRGTVAFRGRWHYNYHLPAPGATSRRILPIPQSPSSVASKRTRISRADTRISM